MIKPGINFRFTPFRTEERDILSLSLGIYDNIYPLLTEEELLIGFDRRFLLDLPYIESLDMNLISPIRITGYYGREIVWNDMGEDRWEKEDSSVYTLAGDGCSVNILGISATFDFFYLHLINRGWYSQNTTKNGGQLSVFYKLPYLGFISIEPAFRADIFNPDKHKKYDKTTILTYGFNLYLLEDHIEIMIDYYHPTEEKGKYIDMTIPNDEVYVGLQLNM
ncbi:MAG: hypothetical protein ACUVWP_04025 [bacterium]